jgi:DNA-binding MarR family transcriptional regulator
MIDKNLRVRLIYQAERLERATKEFGRPSGVIGQSGLVVLRCLLFCFQHTREPSYKAIRKATGLAFSTISGALRRLEAAGLLFIERRKIRTLAGNRVINNLYTFLKPDDSALKGLIPADVARTVPERFVHFDKLEGPLKDALDRLGACIAEKEMGAMSLTA